VGDLRAAAEECIETHISWVFLRPNEVFKLKKPVDFGFLNFTDAASRRAACEAEVELNSRLAPGVYRGVLPVRRDGAGAHRVNGDGEIVDHVVHMERLPVEARADLRLERGKLGSADIARLARRLARFHGEAARGAQIDAFGSLAVIRANVEENFVQARSMLRQLAGEALEREVEERQLEFLRGNAERFARRIEGGFIRDGHGDLRLEHVYLLPDRDPVVIDCIEFNERFRYADVCADIAFLSMDLGWHGRTDLKERLLAVYARETDDHELYTLVDFYESYRAYVRAKVHAFSLASSSLGFDARARTEADARRYLLVALAAERPALAPPRLIAVGGLIASGKSSVADALGERLAVPVIGSDETRKRLLGVAPATPLRDQPWQSAYSPEVTERVYAALLARARFVLESGRSVVLDATFGSRLRREAARQLAQACGAAFTFVECRANEAVARARLEARARGPSVSDGRQEIYADLARRHEPVTELAGSEHLPVDSSGTLEQSLEQLERLLKMARP
jgi:aminoglycoside phosphotransferase family enzyme/predicted kinase